jgi:LPS sulfotransferase NodH
MLARSQVAGTPESYFRPASIPSYARAWGVTLGDDGWDRGYVEGVRHHADAGTGCVGMRIMWSDMPPFLERLADLYPDAKSDVERIRTALGIEHFVRLSRTDKVAQAVSLVIAAQTGLWHRNFDGSVRERANHVEPARYDGRAIARELDVLESEEQGWSTWFPAQSVEPLSLTYESLSVDPEARTRSVLRYLGVNSVDVPTVGTAKLATSLNDDWAARFRSEHRPAQY